MTHPIQNARVLLLGGFGRVGIEAAQYLLKTTDARLTLASRTGKTIPSEIDPQYHDRISTLTLDATQPAALEEACQQADLLISCIGPSGIVGDSVARACKKTMTPLVDAGGYDPVIQSLDQAEKDDPTRVPLVINVGLLPGLSGLFPEHILRTIGAGTDIRQLDIHYVGRDAWTYNSAWDIINSLGGFGHDRGFCYLDNGRIVSVPMGKAGAKPAFPHPIGKTSTMLIYAEEIVRLANQHNIPVARVFGANIGPRATMICILAKLMRFYNSDKGLDRGARWLARASEKDMRKMEPAYGIQVDLHDATGLAATAQLMLTDTYQATGTVIGITACCILQGQHNGAGVFMLHEAIPHDLFMSLFEQEDLIRFIDIRTLNDQHTAEASV